MRKVQREQIERAARLYKSNKDASLALGITLQAFGRICKRYGIETPYERRRTSRRRMRRMEGLAEGWRGF